MADNDPFQEYDDLDLTEENGFPGDSENPEYEDDLPIDDEEVEDSKEPAKATSSNGKASGGESKVSGALDKAKEFVKTPIGMAVAGLSSVIVLGGGAMLFSSPPSVEEDFPTFQQDVNDPFAQAAQQTMPTQQGAPGNVGLPLGNQAPAQQPAQNGPRPGPHQTQSLPLPSPEAQQPKSVFTEEDKQLLFAALGKNTNDNDQIKLHLNRMADEAKQMREFIARTNQRLDSLQIQLNEMGSTIKELKAKPVQAVSANQPNQTGKQATKVAVAENPKAAGRTRIPGLYIIDSSASGDMSIIKKESNGRVFTVFKNEVLNIEGTRHKVMSIEDEGKLIFVGDIFYIDEKLSTVPSKTYRETQKAVRPVPAEAASAQLVERASRFSLNAVFDANKGFGVIDHEGNFQTYKLNQNVPELGNAKVLGLDQEGNLRIGRFVIKPSY